MAQGATLGNGTIWPRLGQEGMAVNQATADAVAANVLPVVRKIQAVGATGHRAIAEG
jgi:hypothetical protein